MNQFTTLQRPLESIFWRIPAPHLLRNICLVFVGSLFLTIASKISIPLQPVPITLQTMAIFFIGMTYGWKLGSATLMIYLGQALLGIPVLAENAAGPAVLFGTTGGYIAGWLFAIIISGFLVQHGWGKHWLTVLLAQLIGSQPIYLLGLAVLHLFVGNWQQTIHLGLTPFILTDAIKMVILAFIIPAFWRAKTAR